MRTYKQFIAEVKRLRMVRMYHGTSKSAANKIKRSGFNTSDVYTSTNREIASSFGDRKGENTEVISFRVPAKDVNKPGKIMKTDGQRGVDKWGREHYSTVMNSDYAKKHITIRHLLMMSSGLNWEESGKNPLSHNAASYYGTDLYGLTTNQFAIEKPGKRFEYQSGNSQLLGFIIKKATGKRVSDYASAKIWSKIGTESDAYWSLDKENGDEKSFCCIYGTSRDFARLGRLIKQNGVWNGQEIIPASYMKDFLSNPKILP
jgi:hypothetical protein